MVFSSPVFLFLFLPIVLAGSFLVGRRFQNVFLMAASVVFYAWGEVNWVWVILLSIGANYFFGRRLSGTKHRRFVMGVAAVVNLGLLAIFKYTSFLVDNLNSLVRAVGGHGLIIKSVHLPIGISFFTFHALSYLIDVYRRQVEPQRRIVDFALYMTMFPQLIAGPIVRYHDIADQLGTHTATAASFAAGARRFVLGLGKKVLIANTLASPVDSIFALPSGQLSPGVAWLGISCYMLQIYFDFSGYSDMALGLGRMFGLRFLENFDYPYVARSVTEFWRRWHISLSNWYRDYLYIPLGGNRRGPGRTYLNLIVVFFLCGLWHGASWTFVLWGFYHGAFLVFERMGLARILEKGPRFLRHAYLVIVVMVGWVFFRAESLPSAFEYLAAMLGYAHAGAPGLAAFAHADTLLALGAGVVGSAPLVPLLARLREGMHGRPGSARFDVGWEIAAIAATAGVFIVSASLLVAGTYNPFIYFRF